MPTAILSSMIVADGLRLPLRLTPRARRSAITGLGADADGRPLVQLRVAAPPVEGAANTALVAFLSSALGVRKTDVTLLSGATARVKMVHVAGDGPALAARLGTLLASES
ncbi:DUF167 domain-containing protein [Sphingomonas flavalba]|uniref:DUF167 domain-containing protein n=1 Tax=Sphingomonas flavalba TaxID=2559804 RepID=UPI0039DF8B01